MFLLLASLAVMAMGPVTGLELDCKTDQFRIIPKPDCKGYFICVFGKPVEMPDCTAGSVFSQSAHVCVPANSIYNDCHKIAPQPTSGVEPVTSGGLNGGLPTLPDLGPLSIEEKCQMFGGVYPHPTECQMFYNCSRDEMIWTSIYFPEKYTQECPYPQLFNAETKKCEKFEQVKCGDRKEYTNACDYKRNVCPRSHCIPCYVRYPTCDGKPDGVNPNEAKLWSPYYAVCYKSRTINQDTCPPDASGRTQLFHPNMNRCVSLDLIPQDVGGMMPNCAGLPDGANADDFGRCNQYVVCQDGSFVQNIQCAPGQLFDSLYRICTDADKTCGPCGNRVDC